jgi:hypothetical protein
VAGSQTWRHRSEASKDARHPVLAADKNRALVLGSSVAAGDIPPVTWAFALEPAPGNTTQLLIRWRWQTPATFLDRLRINTCWSRSTS